MKTLKKIYNGIVALESHVALILLSVAIILNAYEIFQRNVLGKSFIWIQEISTLMLLWFALLGMSKIVNENVDIYVDLFIKKFPLSLRKVINVVVYAAITVVLVLIIYNTWLLLTSQLGTTSIVAKYPLWLRSAALLIGMSTMAIKYFASFIGSVAAILHSGKEGRA